MIKNIFALAAAAAFLFGGIICVYWIGGALGAAPAGMRDVPASVMLYPAE